MWICVLACVSQAPPGGPSLQAAQRLDCLSSHAGQQGEQTSWLHFSLFAWLLLRLIQGWITIRILKRSCRALPFQTSCCTSSLLSSSPSLPSSIYHSLLATALPTSQSRSATSTSPLTACFLSHIYSLSLVCICGLSDV